MNIDYLAPVIRERLETIALCDECEVVGDESDCECKSCDGKMVREQVSVLE